MKLVPVTGEQELLPVTDALEDQEYVEEPFFDPDDGKGEGGGSDDEEDLTGDPDADGGSADGNPNPPK